jgi:hypothetical protein
MKVLVFFVTVLKLRYYFFCKRKTKLVCQIIGLFLYEPFLSGIWERYAWQIEPPAACKNILVAEQHGFRKGMTTDNAAFRLTDGVFK